MKDVQSQQDSRGISISQVGIKDFVFPIEITNKHGEWNSTGAIISLLVDLDAKLKGTHMSRFVEIIQQNRRMDLVHMRAILEQIKERLEAKNSFVKLRFNYFIEKESPVTALKSYLCVDVEYNASLVGQDFEFDMKVTTPVTTLCPCSKEISDYSAHNQRANVSITVRRKKFMWIEDLVDIAEAAASSPVYSLLKRPDEKYVTEQAYDNPKFVEDVCREVKMRIDKLTGVKEYDIEVESFESIHNHSAYARIFG